MTGSADAAFERSRQHRRGVRRASIDLEEALARPAGQEAGHWYGEVAVHVRALAEAFRHHVQQSEGPEGLLPEIIEAQPRLVPAVQAVKREHQVLLDKMSLLEAGTGLPQGGREQAVREDSLRLLH